MNRYVKRFSLIFYMSYALVSMLFMGYVFTMNIIYGKTTFAEPNIYLSIAELIIVIIAIILFIYWTIKFLKTVPLEVVN